MALASTTEPRALAPFSITVFPSTTTGSATVAENPFPALVLLELSVSPRRAVITVPAGMVMVSLTGLLAAGLLLALPPAEPPPGAPPAALGFSVEDAGALGLLEHPSTKLSASSATTYSMRIAFTGPPPIE